MKTLVCACTVLALTALFIGTGPAQTPGKSPAVNEAESSARLDRFIDAGGHRLHLLTMGTGSPSVVIDTGLGETHRHWGDLPGRIAGLTRVCMYDRAGYGLSEAGPYPRTPRQAAAELFTLLTNARIDPPYIIVGHSLGGLNALAFASAYKDVVAGIVLLDPPPRSFLSGERFQHLKGLATQQTGEFERRAAEAGSKNDEENARFYLALASEHAVMFSKGSETYASIPDLDSIPLTVIAAGVPNPMFGDSAEVFQTFWIESNRKLASLSKRGTFILAEKSAHDIPSGAPDMVFEAVRKIVADYNKLK